MKPYLTITELAEELGVSPRTLRVWEEKGVIHPTRTSSKQRLFYPDQAEQVRVVKILKDCDFILEDIRKWLANDDKEARNQMLRDQHLVNAERTRFLETANQKIRDALRTSDWQAA